MSYTEQPTKGPFNGKELLRSVGTARRKQIIIALLSFLLPLLFALLLLRRQDVAWQNNGLQGIPVRSLTVSQNTLYAISSGGIFRSSDGVRWQPINNGLPVTLWDGITVHSLVADSQDPTLAYALVGDGKDRLGLFRTTNSGDKWEQMTLPDASEVLHTLALIPGRRLTLFVAGSTGVYRSHDGGESWKWQGIIPRGTTPRTLTADSESPETLYLGTLYHGVFRTTDAGRSWSAVNNGLDNQPIRQLLVNPVDHYVLFALAERGVYRSVDAGQHWQFVGRDLQGQEITTMAAHPSRLGVVYVGTADGQVLLTADAGDTWANLGSRLGEESVAALVFDQDSVRVATDTGLWQFNLELPPDLTPPATIVAIAPSPTSTGTPVPSATPAPTAAPTETPTASLTSTASDTPTPSPTLPPSNTPVPPPTATAMPTPTPTPTPVPPPTATPVPPPTATATPTVRPTGEPPTDTPTPSLTPSPTTPPTPTPTGPRPTLPGGTPPSTARPTTTSAPTPTFTPLPTNTPTITPTVTTAPTPTITATATTTPTAALIKPSAGGTGSITTLGALTGGRVIQQTFRFVSTKHDLTGQLTDAIVRMPGPFRWDPGTPSSSMLNTPPSVVVVKAQSEPKQSSDFKRSDRI